VEIIETFLLPPTSISDSDSDLWPLVPDLWPLSPDLWPLTLTPDLC